jgi:hypothetical protein
VNKYLIVFFNYQIREQGSDAVLAKTAEDAKYMWENDVDNVHKHFTRMNAMEA